MSHNMTREDKLHILQANVGMAIDRLESSLRHNIGEEDADFFIHPIRQVLQTMEDCLKS